MDELCEVCGGEIARLRHQGVLCCLTAHYREHAEGPHFHWYCATCGYERIASLTTAAPRIVWPPGRTR